MHRFFISRLTKDVKLQHRLDIGFEISGFEISEISEARQLAASFYSLEFDIGLDMRAKRLLIWNINVPKNRQVSDWVRLILDQQAQRAK